MNRNWNRAERRRHEKMLRAFARSRVTVAEMDFPKKWTCDCISCSLLRAGACPSCAARINADILTLDKPGTMMARTCSGGCREAIEHYFCR
jgi:hypothetical protein